MRNEAKTAKTGQNSTGKSSGQTGSTTGKGLLYGFGAYLIWGSFPILIKSLGFASPFEVVVWRIVFGLLLAVILVTVTKTWNQITEVFKDKRKFGLLALCSALIFVNWQVYVIGVASSHIVETSLGYFINPLITIVLAVLFQKERLALLQWIAVGFGALAVIVLTFDYGQPPWIALTLAISFGFYGLVKSRIGGSITPLTGYSVETALLLPVAVIQGFVIASIDGLKIGTSGTWSWAGLMLFGFLTAIPLILFGSAAKYLPLSYVGFLQYMTPIIQFILALTVFHEKMPVGNWLGFGLVWVGLGFLSAHVVRSFRR
jgi:chloramphenicol-sensitive protein RarD